MGSESNFEVVGGGGDSGPSGCVAASSLSPSWARCPGRGMNA